MVRALHALPKVTMVDAEIRPHHGRTALAADMVCICIAAIDSLKGLRCMQPRPNFLRGRVRTAVEAPAGVGQLRELQKCFHRGA